MKRPEPRWASEAEMLAAFMVEARAMGFRVLPEACDHDLVLVATPELSYRRGMVWVPEAIEPGDTIAVQGKLRASLEVLRQALPPDRPIRESWRCLSPTGVGGMENCGACSGCRWSRDGEAEPAFDFYAVVVPDASRDFMDLAATLGVCAWVMRPPVPAPDEWDRDRPAMLTRFDVHHHMRVVGRARPEIPDIDVDMPAGMPAPRKLTPWKIAAVRLCLLGMERDLTTADFAAHPPCTARSLVDRGWAELVGRQGRAGVYRLLDSPTRPDRVYPEIVAAVRAKPAQPAPVAEVRAGPVGPLFGGGS